LKINASCSPSTPASLCGKWPFRAILIKVGQF
jgi:hypothetical protein